MAEVVRAENAPASSSQRTYDAFLSYAHRDKDVTAAVQKGLHQIGRRAGQLRALRVFRDDTNLTANPDLWGKITEALGGSRFLIVVLSPQSAASHWVNEEVKHWLQRRGQDGLMLVLAEGQLEWDAQQGRFDPAQSTAVPPVLTEPGSLPEEPQYVDVRDEAPWELGSLVFRDKVTSLAAPIHGKPKDALADDDRREQRRSGRLRSAAIAGLAILTVLSVVAASTAIVQRRKADRQARDALAAQLDTKASAIFSRGVPDSDIRALADTLAAQRLRTDPSASAGALYTATSAMNAVRKIVPTPVSQLTVASTSDGHTLAAGGSDGIIRLWDVTEAANPRPVGGLLRGHIDPVTSVAFSSDGQLLASGSRDGTVRLWNLRDMAHPEQWGQPLNGQVGQPNVVAFSPHGRILATSSRDRTVQLWNVADPARPALLGPPLAGDSEDDVLRRLTFNPDGHILAAVWDRHVTLWNIADPARPEPLDKVDGKSLNCATFSPDGHFLATADRDGEVYVRNLDDPAHLRYVASYTTGQSRYLTSMAFSPSGNILAGAGAGGDIPMWAVDNTLDSRPVAQLQGHAGGVTGVHFSPDGNSLLSAGLDGSVRSWNSRAAEPLFRVKDSDVIGLAFGPTGRVLASAGSVAGASVWLSDLTDPADPRLLGQPLHGHTDGVYSVAFSPDGRTVASAGFDKTIRLWTLTDRNHPAPLGAPLTDHTDVATSVAFTPDSRILASGSRDGSVRVWDVADPGHPHPVGKPLPVGPPGNYVLTVAFSPTGHVLAVAGVDCLIRLWDVADPAHPRPLGTSLAGHTRSINRVAFSPDGRLLASASDDQTIRLWNVTDAGHAQPLGQPLRGHTDSVFDVAFSPDGHSLGSASYDHTARLWNVTDPAHARPLGQPLRAHTSNVMAAAFSPDGHLFVTGGEDRTERLWPTPLDATPAALCSKLTSNISHRQWQDWISPNVGYLTLCPNLPVPQD